PPTNNQLRSSSNSRTHATVHDGQIVTETIQRRAPGNVGNTGSRGNQSYGNVTPYHQLELERRAKVVPTDVSTGSSANISMVTILDEIRDTLDEKTQENQDLSLENQNLTAELAKCKLEIVRLDT
ncbi:hypothetical protein Tco_0419930, partial [Tanacetum coccineum]